MKIAVISDIHGNSFALNAVLKNIKKVGVDQIVCLGDLATLGADPTGVISTIRDMKIPCVMGNHDEFMVTPEKVKAYTRYQPVIEAVYWCHEVLPQADKDFLAGLKGELAITAGKYSLKFYHASPFSNTEDVYTSTSPYRLDRLLEGRNASAIVMGHTHMQMLVWHDGTMMLNPGSVGSPFKAPPFHGAPVILPVAQYAVLNCGERGMDAELFTLELDRKGLEASLLGSSYLMRELSVKLLAPA